MKRRQNSCTDIKLKLFFIIISKKLHNPTLSFVELFMVYIIIYYLPNKFCLSKKNKIGANKTPPATAWIIPGTTPKTATGKL